jgi:hypothetical protein
VQACSIIAHSGRFASWTKLGVGRRCQDTWSLQSHLVVLLAFCIQVEWQSNRRNNLFTMKLVPTKIRNYPESIFVAVSIKNHDFVCRIWWMIVGLYNTITKPAFPSSWLQPQFSRYCSKLNCDIFLIIISDVDMNLVIFNMRCGLYNMLNDAFKKRDFAQCWMSQGSLCTWTFRNFLVYLYMLKQVKTHVLDYSEKICMRTRKCKFWPAKMWPV